MVGQSGQGHGRQSGVAGFERLTGRLQRVLGDEHAAVATAPQRAVIGWRHDERVDVGVRRHPDRRGRCGVGQCGPGTGGVDVQRWMNAPPPVPAPPT